MSVRRVMIAAPVACLLLVSACGSDDDSSSGGELDCEAGLSLSGDFSAMNASADAPSVDSLEDLRERLDDWSAPDEISDEVETVKDGVDAFIEALGDPANLDLAALEEAGSSMSDAGQAIDAYLADNC